MMVAPKAKALIKRPKHCAHKKTDPALCARNTASTKSPVTPADAGLHQQKLVIN